MKSMLALGLAIFIYVAVADKHNHDIEPHRTKVSKPINVGGSPSRRSKVSYDGCIFPCPMPEDIVPCICSHSCFDMSLDCSAVSNDFRIQEILEEYFPIKYFFEFIIASNINIRHLNQTHDIRFREITVKQSSLEILSFNFLKSSAHHLKKIDISSTELRKFPFNKLKTFTALEDLTIQLARLTDIGRLVNRRLKYIDVSRNNIATIETDAFRDVPKLTSLLIYANPITTLQAKSLPIRSNMASMIFGQSDITTIEPGAFIDGSNDGASAGVETLYIDTCKLTSLGARSIPLTKVSKRILLSKNQISVISNDAFFILSEPGLNQIEISLWDNELSTINESVFGDIMKYTSSLVLDENPLECGCDIAWIVRDTNLMSKISDNTTCANGTYFSALQEEGLIDCPP